MEIGENGSCFPLLHLLMFIPLCDHLLFIVLLKSSVGFKRSGCEL